MSRKVHIGARIEPDLHAAISQEAQENGTTLSEEVSRLLSNGLSAGDTIPSQDEESDNVSYFLYDYFPGSWVEELFYGISQEYEDWRPAYPLSEAFFPELAVRVEAMTEEEFERTGGLLAMPDLPEDLKDDLEELLYELTNYSEEITDREAFLFQWAELLREASSAEPEEEETYELLLQFEEAAIVQIRKLLVKKGLEKDEELDTALSRYIYQLLGKALVREAGPYLLAWNGEEEMARVGEQLQKTGYATYSQ
ncbi:hypothetical protein [Phaeodactylibacter luteus]|uniref:Uncharacterized protein n=1 Tax=Phaeodactylibacter luteus TaxID=1564516 RepID=A0A5C6RG37_9BACT|nr:hypothetical protein [Phaeodactylibacter luteus]TXB60625.1 hypothetical protein FRY97_20215 [Phaeodactylibacter luteus]